MKEINRGRKNLIAEFESLTENFGTYVRQFEKDASELKHEQKTGKYLHKELEDFEAIKTSLAHRDVVYQDHFLSQEAIALAKNIDEKTARILRAEARKGSNIWVPDRILMNKKIMTCIESDTSLGKMT